ncbi:hypothetical protein PAPYR_8146 [Paratrimastix pyriformis]|uniref:F-box domain-containing protein n=1 Tax=Paratrimastix pyriformis TaxID=342808 RepID=A0ABQ8UBA4_9EUKA|nr:hypothetical protein PAPYR_8146 [Paratrimastix pyriformis]
MDRLPNEMIPLIYQQISTGKALTLGSLVSRRFRDLLWNDNNLWKLAYAEDYGKECAHLIELYGNFRNIPSDQAPSPQNDINWRQKYKEHRDFLHMVHQDRKRRLKEDIIWYRRNNGPHLEQFFSWLAWGVMSPLLSFVAVPLLLVFVVLRAEGITGWSLHAVLAPADYIFLCGLCFFGYQALTVPQPKDILAWWLLTAIFPVAIGTTHWAAARGDWMVASSGRQTSSSDVLLGSPRGAQLVMQILISPMSLARVATDVCLAFANGHQGLIFMSLVCVGMFVNVTPSRG